MKEQRKSTVIKMPNALDFKKIVDTLSKKRGLDAGGKARKIRFVLEKKTMFFMSALAFLASWGLLQRKNGTEFEFSGDPDSLNYLSRMDLFRILGFDYKEEFSRKTELGRFQPIILIESSNDAGHAVNSACELILHQFDNARAFIPAFEWALYEVIDNIVNHAQIPVPGVVCAQYYPRQKIMDVAVCDMGRGVLASLSESQKLLGHGDALEKAIQRGVTRRPGESQGNGLAGTFEISRINTGSFRIWSGDSSLKLKPDNTDAALESLPASVPGTGVNLRLKTDHPVQMNQTFMGKNSWSYIEKESERVDKDGLRIIRECAHTGGRPPAERLRRKIENILPDMEDQLKLDFSGTGTCSSSFLDELLGKLLEKLGEANFKAKIRITNAPDQIIAMANVVIHQRLETAKGKLDDTNKL